MAHPHTPFQLLELNIISAQDLSPVSRNMRIYAVAWIHPDRKLSTRVDTHGHQNPTWNDKFVFRVDEDFLYGDTSAVMIDIYALHWFKDIHVGSVRVLITNLIPFPRSNPSSGMRFGALQVRRQSGRPQGILNIGVALLDSSMRSMPLYTHNTSAVGYRHLMGEKDAYEYHNHMSPRHVAKPELRRSKSDTSSMVSMNRQQQQIMYTRGPKGNKANSVTSASDNADESIKSEKKLIRSRSSRSAVSDGEHGGADDGVEIGRPSDVMSDPGSRIHWEAKIESPESLVHGSDLSEKLEPELLPPPAPEPEMLPEPEPVRVKSPKAVKNSNASDKQKKKKNQKYEAPESVTAESETTEETHEETDKFDEFENQRMFQKPQYEMIQSHKPQFRNSPGPKLIQTPKMMFGNSRKTTPMHPAMAAYGGSRMATPMHPTVAAYGNSRKNTPLHQIVAYGNSRKATTPKVTPMNPMMIGKFNPALEYATPRRSNLAGIHAPVITESELGPSPSEVAAALAKNPRIDEGDGSTVCGWSLDESVEGLQSKLERWKTELPPIYDRGGESSSYNMTSTKTKSKKSAHNRRHTDGGNGLFSCFSNICGCECSIVCGGDNPTKKKANRRRRTPSVDDASFL